MYSAFFANLNNMDLQYTPFRIYKNLGAFFKSRKLVLVSGALPFGRGAKKIPDVKGNYLTEDKFIQIIKSDNYIAVEAKDFVDPEKPQNSKVRRFRKNVSETNKNIPVSTYVIIISEDSKYSTSSAEFSTLLERLMDLAHKEKRKNNLDIIIISEKPFKTNVTKKMEEFIKDGSDSNPYVDISQYPYYVFSSNILEHKLVPLHEILNKDEEKEILEHMGTSAVKLGKILKNDPPIIWIGAIPGDVIKITSDSPTSGKLIEYAVVK